MYNAKFREIRNFLLYLKIILILGFLYFTSSNVLTRVQEIGMNTGLLVFAGLWLITAVSIVLLSFSQNNMFKITFSLIIIILGVAGKSYFLVTSVHLTFGDFETLIKLGGFVDDVLQQYNEQIFTSLSIGLLGLLALLLPPGFTNRFINTKSVSIALFIPVFLISSIIYERGGEGTNALPDYNNILSFGSVYLIASAIADSHPARNKVQISAKKNNDIQNIIFIMDESVRGDYLDLNSAKGIKTNLPVQKLVNFGIATSATNCSASTNVSVRFGVNRDNYLQDVHKNPSFWAYANKAGYTTFYIDGQRNNGYLMNDMNKEEKAEINNFIQLDSAIKPQQRDMVIARKISALIKQPGKKFIFTNKMGVHFPYESKYPVSLRQYKPTMELTYSGNKIDPSSSEAEKPRLSISDVRNRVINSYKNALNWNVSHFFKTLLDNTNLNKTLIIYTSDHGQDFHEDGRHGWRTHCRINKASLNEGIVPLFFLTDNKQLLDKLGKAAKENYNNVNHFNIFPTILRVLGYPKDKIIANGHTEKSIFEALPENNRKFISYFYTRFGNKTIWNDIDK